MLDQRCVEVPVAKIAAGSGAVPVDRPDNVAVEEPLEIRLAFGPKDQRSVKPVAVTMRTPGEDFDLAVGFLFAEGILRDKAEVQQVIHCGLGTGSQRFQNVVKVELRPEVPVDIQRLERHFYMTSSCGVCGKTSIEAIAIACSGAIEDGFGMSAELIHVLPEFLRSSQTVFDRTGGLHAAALFDREGRLLELREDVGRHNAVDKLIGAQFTGGKLPASERVLLVSGRASFELMQKTIMAGIPVMAAVGAPSSLAVELAQQFNVTLLGFVRNNRFNVYAGQHRLFSTRPAAV